MKSVKFEEANAAFGEKQPEYETLHALAQNNGIVTSCFELEPGEILPLINHKLVKIRMLVFGMPAQPLIVGTLKPKFPVSARVPAKLPPTLYREVPYLDPKTKKMITVNAAEFYFNLNDKQITNLKKERKLWLTQFTYGSSICPLSLVLEYEKVQNEKN